MKILTNKGQGSGFIITADGSVLTAYHVVKEATSIRVVLSSGSSYSARVEKYDETYTSGGSDVALLRISASGLPTVTLGDSDTVKIGHSIIVMGYPLDMGFSVTRGIISSIVDFGGGRTVFVIDAAVNPGNSGGPLLNDQGQVIGIVFGKANVPGITVEGINFATPINTARRKLGLGMPAPEQPPTTPRPVGMVLIPAGEFQMGDSFNEGESEERPVHTVYVSAFYMYKYEVTKALWDEVASWAAAHGYDIKPADGDAKAPDHPVWDVTWYEAVKWANARSEREGLTPAYYTSSGKTTVYRTGKVDIQAEWVRWDTGYRLPTEAEWEKAARGGCEGHRFPWCDTDTIQHSRANYYSDRGYSYDTSPTRGYHPDYDTGGYPYTSPVGSFVPNGYGLYDMAGNLWEWVWDWYGSRYYSSSPGTDPLGPGGGSYRVLRGGSWAYNADGCRVAYRSFDAPDYSLSYGLGFRAVLPAGQ